MDKNRDMFEFVYILLGFLSIFTSGPVVPFICLIIAISIVIYKVKRAKESIQGFEALKRDIIFIIILLVIDIGFFAMEISVQNEYNKHDYSSSNSQEMSTSDIAKELISVYKANNPSQFSKKGNHQEEIKTGFSNFLKKEIGKDYITVIENIIFCGSGDNRITFEITKNNIKYSTK